MKKRQEKRLLLKVNPAKIFLSPDRATLYTQPFTDDVVYVRADLVEKRIKAGKRKIARLEMLLEDVLLRCNLSRLPDPLA